MLILIPIYANRTADMVALDFKKLFFRLIPNFDIFGIIYSSQNENQKYKNYSFKKLYFKMRL